jgi:hypothetical protein
MTRLVSPRSIALTGDGVRQWASTPVTSNRDSGMCSRGSWISGSTPAGSIPVSSAASRIAVAGGPVSQFSRAPGNATSPAWSRRLGARCCRRTSGPAVTVRRDQDQDCCLPLGGRVSYGIVAAQLGRASRGKRVDKAGNGAGTTTDRSFVTASHRARSSISERSTFRSLTGFLAATQSSAPPAPDPFVARRSAPRRCDRG